MSEHELWNELGNLYFMSGAYDQAAHAYRRSIQVDPGFGRPYSNLALAYVQQGKYQEAIELYRRSIELLNEDKERAISWNRLGSVYRQLKDYSKAVIAFQEADELDPQSAEQFAPEAPAEAAEMPRSIHDEELEAEPAVEAVAEAPELMLIEQVPATEEPEPVVEIAGPDTSEVPDVSAELEPEVEWWDVDESHVLSAGQAEPLTLEVGDDPNASWTSSDLSQFQQDLSQMPETGSLTTWGDTEPEEEFDPFPILDPDPELDLPDPEEQVSTWIAVPEEIPANLDDLQALPVLEEEQPEPEELPVLWNEPSSYHTVDSTDFSSPVPAVSSAPYAVELVSRNEPMRGAQQAAAQTWDQVDVDVAVEERSAPETAAPALELPQLREPEPIVVEAPKPEPVAVMGVNPLPLPPEPQDQQRDEDDMHEVELGIAKFRRVVQVNPRNAHAWDALGTLYKAAGLYRDAILAYQQAISNDASRSLYYHHLGLVYACEGRDEDAIGAFQKVIEIDPEYSLAHATLGGYYRKMGLEELAQKHIGKAMKNIFDSENEYNRACLEAICGNADQAIELLGVALKNKQTYVDWILRDPDLDFIRQDPRFKQLISDYTR